MAPEVLTTKKLTTATDVFAFAYLIYETLTLKIPHEQIKNEDIIKYLEKNPKARPSMFVYFILMFKILMYINMKYMAIYMS